MFKFNDVFNKRPDYTTGKKINKNNSSTIGDIFNLLFGSKKVNLELPKIEKKVDSHPHSSKVKKDAKLERSEKPSSKRSTKDSKHRSRKLSNSSVSKLTTDKDAVSEINAMFQEFIRNSKKEVKKPYFPHETYLDDEIESEASRKGLRRF
jgi:hypothetical protein